MVPGMVWYVVYGMVCGTGTIYGVWFGMWCMVYGMVAGKQIVKYILMRQPCTQCLALISKITVSLVLANPSLTFPQTSDDSGPAKCCNHEFGVHY